MQFNPDRNKQANEVIFSRKTSSNNLSHSPLKFSNNDISKCPDQKHLGIVLDSKLNFNAQVDQKIKKCNRIIDLIRRLLILKVSEKVQYRTCLAKTGAIQGTSRTKLYDKLRLHSLNKRRWCNVLIFFAK